MWLVESYGPVVEVEAFPGEGLHARCDPSYREKVVAEMASYGNGIEKLIDFQQPRPQDHFERRELNGIFPQKQPGLFRVGVHVPVGRLSVTPHPHPTLTLTLTPSPSPSLTPSP